MKQNFPKDFLWGAATSAHQIEGGNKNNDWYVNEGRGVPVAGVACDSYNRYEEDFDLAVSLGHNAHRLSLEWSRIEPTEGQFSQEAVTHYRKVLTALRQRGLKSFVTLWHFTLPIWIVPVGATFMTPYIKGRDESRPYEGWESAETVKLFERYVRFCAENFGDLVDFWITLNEPFNIYAPLTRLNGVWPPFKRRALLSFGRVEKHLLEAHKRSYKILKEMTPNVPVGLSENLAYFKPKNSRSLLDRLAARLCQFVTLDIPLRLLARHLDFIGVNQYFSYEVTSLPPSIKPLGEGIVKSDLGWKLNPPAMYLILSKLKKFKKPIYITENGVADASDSLRQTFIKDTLGWVEKALSEQVDVRGYLHWSLLDNYEWLDGFKGKFGLIQVDFENGQKRVVRKSGEWFKEFIDSCRH